MLEPEFHISTVCKIFRDIFWTGTREEEVQQYSASSVLDAAHGGKIIIQDEEEDAAEEAGHANGDAVVTRVSIVVEDAEQTLTADVDVALVHDAAEHHDGENLRGKTRIGRSSNR